MVAPAGWGKTTLLASWARQTDTSGSVGWFSIDEGDDEPVRFWTYALSALATVAPEVTGDALAALGAPGLDPLDVALAALLNSLAATADRKVLVLDDYHLLVGSGDSRERRIRARLPAAVIAPGDRRPRRPAAAAGPDAGARAR